VVADPNFAAMYATRSRKVKTDLRDARTLAEACKLGAYRAAHRTSDRQRHVRTQLSDAGGAGGDESALHLADLIGVAHFALRKIVEKEIDRRNATVPGDYKIGSRVSGWFAGSARYPSNPSGIT
jgi:hypothetical protein